MNLWELLVRRFLLRNMPQAAAFDQAVKILGEVRGVISGALQSLSHKQHVEASRVSLRDGFRQMFLEEAVADTVDLFIHLQDLAGALQIEPGEALVNQVEHVAQNCRHLH